VPGGLVIDAKFLCMWSKPLSVSNKYLICYFLGFMLSLGICWILCAVFVVIDYFLKKKGKKIDVSDDIVEPPNIRSQLRKLPLAVWGLLKRKTFLLFNFSLATEGLVISRYWQITKIRYSFGCRTNVKIMS